MKKYSKVFISVLIAACLSLSGCSLSNDSTNEATEYLSEGEGNTSTEEASAADSIVVVDKLFEPTLEETVNEAASQASSEDTTAVSDNSASAASSVEQKEPVEIVFFGDSQIANGRSEGTDIPTMMGKRIPNSIIYNLGIGGTTASVEASTNSVSADSLHSTSFLGMTYLLTGKSDRDATLSSTYPNILETMNKIDTSTVDYYFIEYGANDFINGVPLDVSFYESEANRAHAFYNSLCMGIDVLRSASPDATIILMTPFYGLYVTDDGTYIGDSYIVSNGIGTLSDYAQKSGNVSEDKQVVLFDGMFMSKCDLYLDTASEYLMDNLHLSLKGRQIFARLLAHYVNFEEQNEPYAYLETDFIKIAEFDPDEYYQYPEDQMKLYYPESWEKYIQGIFPLAQPSQEAVDAYNAEKAAAAAATAEAASTDAAAQEGN